MAPGGSTPDRKHELQQRLKALQEEFARLQTEMASVGAGESLPGLYLVVEVQGFAAALSSASVAEIVRLVETQPLPQAPQYVLGTFLYRGEPVLAVDLARYLGRDGEPALDAHVLVMRGSPPKALVVDRVRSLVEAPLVARADESERASSYFTSRLVAGLVKVEQELVPLLNIEPLLEGSANR
jgi:chemotaxis signal transduction protein